MNKSNEKPIWIIGALISILIIPSVFIVGLAIGLNMSTGSSLSNDTLSSWVGAFATVSIAMLTFILALETWKLRRLQNEQIDNIRKNEIRPNLEIYLESSPVSFQFMNLHVENNGKGIAKNIEFVFSGENGQKLNEYESAIVEKFNSLNLIRNGLANLGAGKNRSSFIFSFIDLTGELGGDIFEIKVNVKIMFSDSEGNKFDSQSTIDFSEFKGITEIGGGDPTYNLYKETEKIRKLFEGSQSSMTSKRLNINVHTHKDRERTDQFIRDKFHKPKVESS